MQQNQIPKYATEVVTGWASLLPATGACGLFSNTNYVSLYTAPSAPNGAGGVLIDSLVVSSNDSAAVKLVFVIKTGSTYKHLGVVNVLTLSGTDGLAPSVDALDNSILKGLPVNAQGKRYIRLKAGDELMIGSISAITSAKVLSVAASGIAFLDNP